MRKQTHRRINPQKHFTFLEFFAGAGMARMGLGSEWTCLFSNDFDHKKSVSYRANWGDAELKTSDIRSLTTSDVPGSQADMAWGSFPCQDLSLAGAGAGLKGERSGTFYPFWKLMKGLDKNGRAPKIIALENVCGALTSHGGKDFSSICSTFSEAGYCFGAVVIDAALFLPQSRPRLFFIGVHKSITIPSNLIGSGPKNPWQPRSLVKAQNAITKKANLDWIWWDLPLPEKRIQTFSDVIDSKPVGGEWHSPEETAALLAMMTPVNHLKLEAAKKLKKRVVGAVYKRTRIESGVKYQRAEVRFDGVSGCLRTPGGGSSRQFIVEVQGERVRSRLITTRETARLMGLPDSYQLPEKYNEGYHLTGDGVAVPVVRHLAAHLLEPILKNGKQSNQIAA